MPLIKKKLSPSFKKINSLNKMKKVNIEGISFIEKRNVSIIKSKNNFNLNFETQYKESKDIESVKYKNLKKYTLKHRNTSYFIPNEMSRIARYSFLTTPTNKVEIKIDSLYTSKIELDKKYYYRYIIPIDNEENFNHFEHYLITTETNNSGNLIKIINNKKEIHFYQIKYDNKYYLITETLYKCTFNELEELAHSTLLSFGFFSNTFHLDEAYIIPSNRKNFNKPVGLYYKSLRKTISSQYNIFTTNSYSILVPISKNMNAINAESRMMDIIEKKWKFRVQPIKKEVFSEMVSLLSNNEPISRATLLLLSSSKLGLELQAGAFCIAFEAICNFINKAFSNKPKKIINQNDWKIIKKDLLSIIQTSNLNNDAKKFSINKINNLNQPTNSDKLTESFKAIKYNLNENEIKVIRDRNLFLHGNLNVKNNEDEIDKLFYTSIMLHRLCCTLILKICKFDGHIINNIALHSSDINKGYNEWGFKKI